MRLQHMHHAARYIGRLWRDSRNDTLQAWKSLGPATSGLLAPARAGSG